jgi:hypothetical protein
MSKKLSGTTMIRDGVLYDYCFVESIKCLQELCEEVIICDAGSTDGTVEILRQLEDNKTKVIYREPDEWESLKPIGKERLNYFSNLAIEQVSHEWNYYQQGDEVTSQDCYDAIHKAVNCGISHSYFVKRINLWGSPYTRLNVMQNRMPCSEAIVRLAQSRFRTYSDAESICVDAVSDMFFKDITMVHYGFVRKPEIMLKKAINMQDEVFQMGSHDVKLDNCDKFEPERWFSGNDLVPFNEHPKIMQKWVNERSPDKQG